MEEQNEFKDAGSALAEQEQAATEQEQTAAPAEPERPEAALADERQAALTDERQDSLADERQELLADERQELLADERSEPLADERSETLPDEGRQTLAEERPEPTLAADERQETLAAGQPEAPDAPDAPITEPQDFGAVLAEHERTAAAPAEPEAPKTGSRISGRIVSIGEENALVDLGTKSEGFISLSELRDAEGNVTVQVGQTIDAVVTGVDEGGAVRLKVKPGRGGNAAQQKAAEEIKMAQEQGLPVEGRVTAVNKGGIEVQVSGLRAFCPASQLDLRYVEDPSQFVGQTLAFRVTRFEEDPRGRRPNIILSRRSILEEEAKQKASETRERIKVGATVKGRVTSLTSYGAFVDLGGIEGLLHVSEISHTRVAQPKDVLAVGQEVEVQVTKIEPGKDKAERISLSLRALEPDPWSQAKTRFPEGTKVKGTVARLETFGAFVELAPGIDGLVHISALGAGRRVSHPREVVKPGQEVEVMVLKVETDRRRISLSMDPTAGGETEARFGEVRRERGPERGERGGWGERGTERRAGDRGPRDRDRSPDRGGDRDRGGEREWESGGSGFGSLGDFFNRERRK